MSTTLLAFASTFAAVFTLGLQSRLVNTENYLGAGINSVLISLSHIALYKVMPDAGSIEVAGYIVGGVTGITASIWFHKRATAWWEARKARRLDEHAADLYPACGECGIGAGKPCPRLTCDRYVEGRLH